MQKLFSIATKPWLVVFASVVRFQMDYYVDQLPIALTWKPSVKRFASEAILWGDWFVGLQNALELLTSNPSYVLVEAITYILAFFTLIHACRAGGRYVYLWIAYFMFSHFAELSVYILPELNNRWHSQSLLTLYGRRVPLHVILFYPIVFYAGSVSAKRLRLNVFAEAFASAIGTVLLMVPFDIIAVKLLWFSWHDTDPNVRERMYDVPWSSLALTASYACCFSLLINGARKLLLPKEFDWKLFPRELFCSFIAALLTVPMSLLVFAPLFQGFQLLAIPAQTTAIVYLGVFACVMWTADRSTRPPGLSSGSLTDLLFFVLVIYHALLMILVVMAEPDKLSSTGLHEPIGTCTDTEVIRTATGLNLSRRKFLCPHRVQHSVYDFHCSKAGGRAPQAGADGGPRVLEWYTICGTPFTNHNDYIAAVWAFCLFGFYYFLTCFLTSGTPKYVIKKNKQKTQ